MNLHPRTLIKPMFISCILFSISACSDSEAPQSGKKTPAAAKSEMPGGPQPMTGPKSTMMEQGAPMQGHMEEHMQEPVQEQQQAPAVLENGVIYQDEIYKNWPYTEAPSAPVETPSTDMMEKKVEEVKAMAEDQAKAVGQKMEAAATAATEAATAATTATTAATASNAPATTAPVDGGQVYNTYCAICHKLGMNAAPKYGSKPLWAKRIAQGRETVYSNALNGLRGMPPRGGFAQLTDEEVKAGVDFMVRAAGGWGDK